jgi:hypothetical protein
MLRAGLFAAVLVGLSGLCAAGQEDVKNTQPTPAQIKEAKDWVKGIKGEYQVPFEKKTGKSHRFVVPKATDDNLRTMPRMVFTFELDLSGGTVTDEGLKHLAGLPRLRKLDLRDNPVTEAGLKHLTGADDLKHLDLTRTKVTDAGIVHLTGLKKLTYLSLEETAITDAAIPELSKLKGLMHLGVSKTKITADGEKKLKEAVPGTKSK